MSFGMSTIAIGDIHGNFQALDHLLNRITPEICSDDTVVFLGDYIDRGSRSKDCIDRILDFKSSTKGSVETLLGNHEQWLMRTYNDYTRHSWLLGMEAFETIKSYSTTAEMNLRREAEKAGPLLITDRVSLPYDFFFRVVPKEHIEFFRGLRAFYQTPEAVYVHGGVNPEIGRLEDQESDDLIWGTDNFPEQYSGLDLVVYGHICEPVIDNKGWPNPRAIARTWGLDTICKGVLTALRLPEKVIIQSDRFK
jgi:serine/threonine protein phosphatase 1